MINIDSFQQDLYDPDGEEKRGEYVERTKRDSTNIVSQLQQTGSRAHWSWVDSSADLPYIPSMLQTFSKVVPPLSFEEETGIPHVPSIKSAVEHFCADKKGKAIGIEFGGIGSSFFSEFTPGFFARTRGINAVDDRDFHFDPVKKWEEDEKRKHSVQQGDLFDHKTIDVLDEWLAGEKATFIIERLGRGMDGIPKEIFFDTQILSQWYERLDEEGIMLIQVPVSFNLFLKEWADMMKSQYTDFFDINVEVGEGEDGSIKSGFSCFYLRKLPGAPEQLPLLSARETLKIEKEK